MCLVVISRMPAFSLQRLCLQAPAIRGQQNESDPPQLHASGIGPKGLIRQKEPQTEAFPKNQTEIYK